MTQKQAYEQLRLQLLFLAEDDVVRTSGEWGGETEGDGTTTSTPPEGEWDWN